MDHILEAVYPIRKMKMEAFIDTAFDSPQSDRLYYSHCHSPGPKYESSDHRNFDNKNKHLA